MPTPSGCASHCRGLGALILLVLVAGCTGFAGGPTPTPPTTTASAPPAPSATATVDPATPTATTPGPATPEPSATPTTEPTLTPNPAPGIEGTARYRSTLSFEEPKWGPGRVTLAYQWLRDGTAISGATDTTYRLAAADIDHQVGVRITGTRSGYTTASQDTASVGPVKAARLKPTVPEVTGSARVGRTLTGTVDPWGPGEVELAWQWYRDGVLIDKATAKTYRLAAADRDHTITLRIRGSAVHFEPASRDSDPSGKVAGGILDPAPVPAWSGTAQVGRTLTALPREWGPGEVKLAYQWYRSGKDSDIAIAKATAEKYRLVAADQGHRIRVRVSGSKQGYETARKYSGWTSEIDPGDLQAAIPTIEGLAVSGRTLTAVPGEWKPAGVKLTVRWYRSGMLITRAEGTTYTLGGADVGHTITVRVRGGLPGYRERIEESEPTAIVVSRER